MKRKAEPHRTTEPANLEESAISTGEKRLPESPEESETKSNRRATWEGCAKEKKPEPGPVR